MAAPMNLDEFRQVWSVYPKELRTFELLFPFFAAAKTRYWYVHRVAFSCDAMLDDALHVDDDAGRAAIAEGLLPFADTNGIFYCVWRTAPDGSLPVVLVGGGKERGIAPSVDAFLELLAQGYVEPMSLSELQDPPNTEHANPAFRAFYASAFGRPSLPPTGAAAVALVEALQPRYDAWITSSFPDL